MKSEDQKGGEKTMRLLLTLTLRAADALDGFLFGQCETERRMLGIREHARILKETGFSL
jgi:hypothetical protein